MDMVIGLREGQGPWPGEEGHTYPTTTTLFVAAMPAVDESRQQKQAQSLYAPG